MKSSMRRWIVRLIVGVVIPETFLITCQPMPSQSIGSPITKATATQTLQPTLTDTEALKPAPTESQTPTCNHERGEIVEASYMGVVYPQEMFYLAYLPPCYDVELQRYPVVYLIHGYPYNQTHWLELGLITEYEMGLQRGDWPSVIFILPFVPDTLFTHTDGGVGSYEQEFLEGLVPAVATDWRVDIQADKQVLGGVSRGGVWALEIGLRHADIFGHVVAISPALVYNQPRPRYDPFEIAKEDHLFPGSLFISAAENETPFREEIEAFIAILEQEGIDHTFFLHPGNHNDQSWRAMMGTILSRMFIDLGS